MQPPATGPVSALPSPLARFLAFAAILVAGVCGGLIGWSVTDLQCGDDGPARPGASESSESADDGGDGGCTVASGLGGVAGAVIGAGGTAVIAVLVLRAMGEWRQGVESEAEGGSPSEPRM